MDEKDRYKTISGTAKGLYKEKGSKFIAVAVHVDTEEEAKTILNQIYSHSLFNVLVVVIRYFGGTKLGVSGLIRAYKTAADEALTEAEIVEGKITHTLQIQFTYALMNDVMRIVKEENLTVLSRDFGIDCKLKLAVDKSRRKIVIQRFKNIYKVKVTD